MYPVNQPAQAVPMIGPGDGYPRQPDTVVNIAIEPPKDHIIWSTCCFFYFNVCCMGLVAYIYSVKARDRKVLGDMDGARHYASHARILNIASTVLVSLFIIIAFITIICVYVQVNKMVNQHMRN